MRLKKKAKMVFSGVLFVDLIIHESPALTIMTNGKLLVNLFKVLHRITLILQKYIPTNTHVCIAVEENT